MRERLREVDFLRAIAALSIVLIHVSASYINVSSTAYYLNQIARYAVPIFILISGLLLYITNNNFSTVKNYTDFLLKRFRKILIPYLIWTLIYILFSNRKNLGLILLSKKAFLLSTLHKVIFGTGYAHLYFIVIILQLYLLYPLIINLFKRSRFVVLSSSFVLTLIFQTGIYLSLFRAVHLPKFIIPYYVFFPTWIFYFVLGMFFASNLEWWRKKLDNAGVYSAIAWLASFIILLIDNHYTNTFASSMKPSIMLYCVTSFVFLYIIFYKLRNSSLFIFTFFDWLSAQSFLVYFSHLLVINVIVISTKLAGFTSLWQGTLGMLELYVTGVTATCLFSLIVGRTPAAEFLGGVRIKRKAPVSLPNQPSM